MSWLKNLKIIYKIGVIVALIGIFTVGAITNSSMKMRAIDDAYSDLIARIDKSAVLAARAGRFAESYISAAYQLAGETTDEGNARLLAVVKASQKRYEDAMTKIAQDVPEKSAIIGSTIGKFNEAFKACDPAIDYASKTATDAEVIRALARLKAECDPHVRLAITEHAKVTDAIVAHAGKASDDLSDVTTSTIRTSAIVVGTGLIICIGLAIFIGIAGLSRPIARLKLVMEAFAKNDLSADVPGTDRHDELGDMARTVEVFKTTGLEVERLKIEQQATAEQREVQRKAEMMKLANDFEGAVGDIIQTVSVAATQLESSANTLTTTAVRTEELSTVVAAASEEASTNVQSVASASEEMASSVNEISRQVQESARIAGEAVSQANKTNDRVHQLSQAANKIGDVVELINTIAGQTNLLALNATIEAARAGDAGRGFAVVASEVKSLAEQTAKATGEIADQIKGIQTATMDSVEAIKEIGLTISRISEISSTIASAVEEQGAATQEISRNVQQASRGTSEVASNISDVQRGSSETGAASSQVLSSARSLSLESNRLKNEVGKFLNTVRAA